MEEWIYKIIELVGDVLEANFLLLFVGIFLAKKLIVKKINRILVYSFGMGIACYFLDHFILVSLGKMVLLFVIYVGCSCLLYKTKVVKSIVMVVLYMAIFTAIEAGITVVLGNVFEIDLSVFWVWGKERICAITIVKIVELFIIILLYKIYKNGEQVDIYNTLVPKMMVMSALLTVMTIFFMLNNLNKKYEEIMTMAYFFIAMCLAMFILYTLVTVSENIDKKQKLDFMQLQNELLQHSLMETKNTYAHLEKSIHDYKNTMLCLNSLLPEEKNSKIKNYVEQELQHIEHGYHFVKTGNVIVDRILGVKILEAERRKICVSVHGKLSEQNYIDEIHWGTLLGNIMDNCIEAAEKSRDKYIDVDLKENEKIICIVITNSTPDLSIDFKVSSKENSLLHGIGLKSVKELVENYRGEFTIKQEQTNVIVNIQIPIKS